MTHFSAEKDGRADKPAVTTTFSYSSTGKARVTPASHSGGMRKAPTAAASPDSGTGRLLLQKSHATKCQQSPMAVGWIKLFYGMDPVHGL